MMQNKNHVITLEFNSREEAERMFDYLEHNMLLYELDGFMHLTPVEVEEDAQS